MNKESAKKHALFAANVAVLSVAAALIIAVGVKLALIF